MLRVSKYCWIDAQKVIYFYIEEGSFILVTTDKHKFQVKMRYLQHVCRVFNVSFGTMKKLILEQRQELKEAREEE